MGKEFTSFRLMFIILGLAFMASGYGSSFSPQKVLQVERKLKHLRRHSKSIQSEDGDIIDCIDLYKQPAFEHPALKYHKIQMAPTYNGSMEETRTRRAEGSSMTLISQIWQKRGRCPKRTIPVRRIRKRDLLKARTIEDYGRKKPRFSQQGVQTNQNLDSSVQQQNHSKAILLAEGYRYLGAKGDMRVFNPYVETDDEYSTSQVSLLNGAYYNYECIEAGWAVNPSVYGDRQTRLFAYWTADASKETGCFDLTCSGFVQTNNEIALGAAINPISLPSNLTFQITIYIYKDPFTNKWWLQYNEETNIGYWPAEIFQGLRGNAESVEWGGEVYSTRTGTSPHTKTHMGNGEFPDIGISAVMTRMKIHDNSAELKSPEWVYAFSDEFNCYGARYVGDYVEDPEFYYGGPGRNPMCP